ncbi:MAG: hypothetical protein ACOYL3_06270 [Desulfuromonadaceae bacterium]
MSTTPANDAGIGVAPRSAPPFFLRLYKAWIVLVAGLRLTVAAALYIDYASVWLTLAGGTSITLLLSALIRNLLGTRSEALRLAEELNLELKEEHQRLTSILDGTRAGTWEWNIQTGEVIFNEPWAAIIGYGRKRMNGSALPDNCTIRWASLCSWQK